MTTLFYLPKTGEGRLQEDMAVSGRSLMEGVLPFPAMIAMECINVGLNTLFKAATAAGMSHHVFVVYSYSFAALLLLPSPFISRRSTRLPPLTFSLLSKIALLGFIGYTDRTFISFFFFFLDF